MRAAAGLAAALAVLLLLLTVSPSRAMTKSRAKITDISPNEGSLAGGTLVTISGAGFERGGIEGITTVYIGNEICKVRPLYTPRGKGEGRERGKGKGVRLAKVRGRKNLKTFLSASSLFLSLFLSCFISQTRTSHDAILCSAHFKIDGKGEKKRKRERG